MYPVSDNFKATSETSMNWFQVIAYREGEGSYWEKDITEWVVDVPEIKYSLFDSSGGYAASISPTLTLTVLNSTEVEALLENLGSGKLSVRVYTYNALGEETGAISEKVLLFDGMLDKQAPSELDVNGKTYKVHFAHPLIYFGNTANANPMSDLPDPFDYQEMVYGSGDNGFLSRRDIVSVFESIKIVVNRHFNVSINIGSIDGSGVRFFSPYGGNVGNVLQETHTPIHRETNGPTPGSDEHQKLGSNVENFVKIRGITYNPNTETIILGIDDLTVIDNTGTFEDNRAIHVPRLCFLTFGDSEYGDYLRMESKPVPINGPADPIRKCDVGYRVLDLHYDSNTDMIYYVIETAQDNLDDTTYWNNNEEWRGKEGIYYNTKNKQFQMRDEGGSKGEKSPRIYFGEVSWANRKAPTFNADKRLKKYHKGIHVYSRRIEFSTTTNIDSAQREDWPIEGIRGFPAGFWRGKEVSQMIGSGTPAVDRRLGVPLPLDRLVCKLVYNVGIGANQVTFGPDYTNRYRWFTPDTSSYIKKGSHVYLMQIPIDQDDAISNGNICYMGKIRGISKQGNLHTIKTQKTSLFNYARYTAGSKRSRVIIIPEESHPTDNIPIPEFESLEVIYNDGPEFFQYAWSTKKDIEIEKRRDLQQRINFFFKTSVDALSESSSYEPEPSLYSFTSNAEIEGFYGYKAPSLSRSRYTYGFWNKETPRTFQFNTEPDGTWTSAEPIPFHIVYKFIDDSNQFKWRYPEGGPIQIFAVANSNVNEGTGSVNPDAGRPDVQSLHYQNRLLVYRNGAWRPITEDFGKTAYFATIGNIWLHLDNENGLWVFTNDFEEANWPPAGVGTTMPAGEWFNNCRIYKWEDDTNYAAGGRLLRKFIDRIDSEAKGKKNFFNYVGGTGTDARRELDYSIQPTRLPTLFTGPGMFNTLDSSLFGGRKTFIQNRDSTGIRVLGACHVELGQNITDLVVGIKGYSGGVQPILILEGDVSDKFDVGDKLELRWSEDSKNSGAPNPLYSPHITYQVLNVETKTANFEGAQKIMKYWNSKLPGVEGKYNENQQYNFRKVGFWTFLTVEGGVPFGDYSQYEEPESIQLSILDACVEKDGLGEAIKINTDGQIEKIINSGNYYYIYKVSKGWPIASTYSISHVSYGKESMEEFANTFPYTIASALYSDVEQFRLPGDEYKEEEIKIPGETLTPKVDEIYNKIPYVTLSKKKLAYFLWLWNINFGEVVNKNYNHNIVYNNPSEISFPSVPTITIKSSGKELLPKLIFSDSEIEEPTISNVLVKPNTGEDLDECRILFNNELEGIDVVIDYRYYVDVKYDGFNMGVGTKSSTYVINSDEVPRLIVEYGDFPKLTTQKGVKGTPVNCGWRTKVMISVPDNNLMIFDDKWTGFIESINFSGKKVWDCLQTLAIANNSYIMPDSTRYNVKTGSSNPMNITLYPRAFGKGEIATVNPSKVKRLSKKEYSTIVVNFKHGKAIVALFGDTISPTSSMKSNPYTLSCEAISEYLHAFEVAKTVAQWIFFGVEYELDLGYLASWLQILDSVEFTYLNENANEEGIEGELITEKAYITSVSHRVGQEGNGTTTLKVVSYTDNVGEPFNPGNPHYKSPPQEQEEEPA